MKKSLILGLLAMFMVSFTGTVLVASDTKVDKFGVIQIQPPGKGEKGKTLQLKVDKETFNLQKGKAKEFANLEKVSGKSVEIIGVLTPTKKKNELPVITVDDFKIIVEMVWFNSNAAITQYNMSMAVAIIASSLRVSESSILIRSVTVASQNTLNITFSQQVNSNKYANQGNINTTMIDLSQIGPQISKQLK